MIEELLKLWEEYEEWRLDGGNVEYKWTYPKTFDAFMRWLREVKRL